jgi:hypothetical protein
VVAFQDRFWWDNDGHVAEEICASGLSERKRWAVQSQEGRWGNSWLTLARIGCELAPAGCRTMPEVVNPFWRRGTAAVQGYAALGPPKRRPIVVDLLLANRHLPVQLQERDPA